MINVKNILDDKNVSNDEILEIKGNLHVLAEIAIEEYIKDNNIDLIKIN